MEFFDDITEFKTSKGIRKRLQEYSVVKTFKEGENILNEGVFIKSIPIIASGSVKVMRTHDDGCECQSGGSSSRTTGFVNIGS